MSTPTKACGVLAIVAVLAASAAPAAAAVPFSPARPVALLAGQGDGDVNQTRSRFGVHATDLGIMWRDSRGRTAVVFGDTYGEGWGGHGAGPETADWRFNVLGHSADTILADGLRIDSMVEDRPGHAAEILHRDPAVSEVTVIPTAAVAVGSRDYIHYMSIRGWEPWTTNYSGVAYSDDGGRTWVKPAESRWLNQGGSARFQMGAFVRNGGFVYLFGTPNGRFGNAHVARVAEPHVLDPAAYEYWTASGWRRDVDASVPVFGTQVGELSVLYHNGLRRWVSLALDESRAAIVLRTAPAPNGPWSGGRVVAHGVDYPALYGGFVHPASADGPDLYFSMSQWGPYHSKFMRLRLSDVPTGSNLLSDGGFEDRPAGVGPGPWRIDGRGGIDQGLGLAHSGRNNGWVRHDSGWNALSQGVVVRPGQRYRLTGWVRSSASGTDGYFGVRRPGGGVVAEQRFGHFPDYRQLTVEFTADTTEVEVFGGTWGRGVDTWAQLDDVLLEPVTG
ncbi:hypothetical protein FHS29_004669 [Saccharothrix tamanrassetensis]|uniref:DUF4185 domain-containing protein n=1 Tax=Saccharothrix tamanrassetensis TaxID=1051531 RepID=A0A841CKK6_9PSEU|nr:DUF4185 domain-containing protein [Saccharothrix tamanrassetensis]MBB5958061.1 hypothetical protein [Saccharothrix tamanrassetensis]